jgi:hypothetical protein
MDMYTIAGSRKEPQKAQMRRQLKPRITIDPARAKSGEWLYVMGTGCTPSRTVLSHMLRPNATEYNPLRVRTDARGEFTHKIDTTMLDPGTYEVWVEDEASKTLSNRAQFNVQKA